MAVDTARYEHGGARADFAIDPWLVVAFAFPLLRLIVVDIGGKLYAQDIAAVVLAVFLLAQPDTAQRLGQIRTMLLLLLLWLLGQVMTDIYRESAIADFSRGWSRIGFFGVQLIALWLFVVRRPAYLIAYSLGFAAASGLVVLQLEPPLDAEPWKFGLGVAVSTVVAVMVSAALPGTAMLRRFAGPAMIALALLLLFENSRAGFGVALISGVYCIVSQALQTGGLSGTRLTRFHFAAMLLGGLAVVQAATAIYSSLAENGTLGEAARAKYEIQTRGDINLLQGGRIESLVSTVAIADSPILGHGSWARDYRYMRLLRNRAKELGLTLQGDVTALRKETIPSHSYFFGAWVDAGILGGVFWLYILSMCLLGAYRLLGVPQLFLPLSIFTILTLVWNTLFSPFGADSRFIAAYHVVVLFWVIRNSDAILAQASRMNRGP